MNTNGIDGNVNGINEQVNTGYHVNEYILPRFQKVRPWNGVCVCVCVCVHVAPPTARSKPLPLDSFAYAPASPIGPGPVPTVPNVRWLVS